MGCSGGSLAGLLGSLGVLWVSLGRPLVPPCGALVSLWRPLGCVGCLLGAPWCLKVVFWAARGWLFGSLGAVWCVFSWSSGFLADSCGVSEGWTETQQQKKEQSKRKRDTPTRTQHPLQNRASRSMTHRFWRSGFRFGLFLVGFCWYLQHFRKVDPKKFQGSS